MSTRERILAAARRAFDRRGLEGLSLRAIAAKIGLTPMAIYRHFENKEALIDALVLDALAEWTARLEALPPAEGLERLEQIADAFLEFALCEPRRFEAAFLLTARKARRYPDDFAAGLSPAGNIQLKAIQEAVRQGVFVGVTPADIMLINGGLAQGLVTLYRAGRIVGGEKEFRTLFRSATRRVFASFGKEARR